MQGSVAQIRQGRVHWVHQRCCVRRQGQVWQKHAKGDPIRRGGSQQASHQRRPRRTPCQGWQLAEYNNEPLTTRAIGHVRHARWSQASCHEDRWLCTPCQVATSCIRVAYTMQGNNKPLTTTGDWATTFKDHEGTKALTNKLIVLNRNPLPLQWSAIAPAIKLVCLQPPS